MNLDLAVTFINDQGNPAELARLNYLLHGRRPPAGAIEQLLAGQRPDGGWPPFWAADYSSLDATCYRLAQAGQMGLTRDEAAIGRAVQFLAHSQRGDGRWEEDESVAGLAPPWARPGDRAACLYLTANCAFWIAIHCAAEARCLVPLQRGAAYLLTGLEEDGRLPSFLHAHWLAGGLWHSLDWPDPAGQVMDYLHHRLDDLSPANLAWLLTALRAAGVPAAHPLLDAAASRLAQAQRADGRWPGDDGPDWDVHTTLEALRALRLCGRFS